MVENKSSLKSIRLLERLKQDDGLIGCAVAHALEVECSSMDNCSACRVETCNRMGKLIWQDMNDYVSTCKIDGKNIFDLRRVYVALVDENTKLMEQLNSFSENRELESMDPTEYKLDGMTIFQWRKENRALAARVRELESSYDQVIDDKHALMDNLVRALNAKPEYAELHAFIADLEKCILDISEAVNGAIEVVYAYESN